MAYISCKEHIITSMLSVKEEKTMAQYGYMRNLPCHILWNTITAITI
jgi:hypothetical protein